MTNTLILIPSRMAATRLPGKPLLRINNLSIISNVFKRAEEANIGEVVVATEDEEIIKDVLKNGGKGILTSKKHKTGTDRIFEAYTKLNIKNVDYINIDTEGTEMDVIKGINFDNIQPILFTIEDNSFEKNQKEKLEKISFMEKRNYELINFIGVTMFFIKKDIVNKINDLIKI